MTGQVTSRTIVALCACGAFALGATPAGAAIPGSLHDDANCETRTPHSGYSYVFCDDGLPPTGGTTANTGGVNAVTVPAKYDGYIELPDKAADAATVPGADVAGNIALDVDVSLPTTPAPAGGYPLIFFMHGCCAGSKTSWEGTSFDEGGERWHYNNAWFASRGYAVVNYTARGFVNGNNQGSTGQAELDSRSYEINDYQHLACQLAGAASQFDDVTGTPVSIDPDRVVTTGGSYGGGFSWMALTDPLWTCDATETGSTAAMSLVATAPKYGWTDLVHSLVPTGMHRQATGPLLQTPALPAANGCDSGPRQPDGSTCPPPLPPVGIPKQSIVAALYASGKTGVPPGSAHTTFPPKIDEGIVCLEGPYPPDPAGVPTPQCASTINSLLPEFLRERSAYYQDAFFANIAADPDYRIPVFSAATFTDPLFPPVEHRRMLNRLRSVVPDYPIQVYHGDYQHFVQNKAKEWGDLCGADHHVCRVSDYPNGGAGPSDLNADPATLVRTGVTSRLNRFVDHYAQPSANSSEPQPSFDVTAALQVCPQNAGAIPADEPGDRFTAPTFEQLTNTVFEVNASGDQPTSSDAEPNPHATRADPLANQVSNGSRCPVETQPAGPGVATYDSDPLSAAKVMIGATEVTVDFDVTPPAEGFQLNSRLYDVFPDGTAVMVDRGPRRVTAAEISAGSVIYELHGNGWRFETGHRVRIEIAQDDGPYLRPATAPSGALLHGVELRMPVREPDTDGDGVPDAQDQCPNDAGPTSNNGCPDVDPPTDTDGDGVIDADDDCPNDPGPASPTPGQNGCPPPPTDSDGDGVSDGADLCPEQAGPASNEGCPLDSDGDGVPDDLDPCPDRPGTPGGSGCPEASVPTPEPEPEPGVAPPPPAEGRCANVIKGGPGDEDLTGTSDGDDIAGKGGRDLVQGRGGEDCLRGGSGPDEVHGGPEADALEGGTGRDVLAGGPGRDDIDCGPGRDFAIVGAGDDVRRCEGVRER